MSASTYLLVYTFVLGACIGSFLNVCIVRWPEERSILRPRSRCPRCGNQLSWIENIPVVSWLLLRGKCRCCDERISVMYPLVELAVGLGWMAAAWHFGFTFTAFRVAVFGTTLLGQVSSVLEDMLLIFDRTEPGKAEPTSFPLGI